MNVPAAQSVLTLGRRKEALALLRGYATLRVTSEDVIENGVLEILSLACLDACRCVRC
jgi:hypothetical protein